MTLIEKAVSLIDEWTQYRSLHYSTHTEFSKAVDIEIEKDALIRLARELRTAIINEDEKELQWLVNSFAEHLSLVKDQLTIEILRTGIPEKNP